MKFAKKFLALALCLVLCLGLCATAFADTSRPMDPLASCKINVVLNVADGITIADFDEYTIKFDGVATDTVPAADLFNKTKEVQLAAQSGDVTKASFALSDVFSASEFSHAGVWKFDVYQARKDAADPAGTLTVDNKHYVVLIHVVNDGSTLTIPGAIIWDGDDKSDPTQDPATEIDNSTDETKLVDGAVGFVNKYVESIENGLSVKKAVAGDYADKTKAFDIKVDFTIPATAEQSDIVAPGTITWADSRNGSVTLSLKHNDAAPSVFTKVPTGTVMTISEEAYEHYYAAIADANNVFTAVTNNENQVETAITTTATTVLTAADVTVTNTFKDSEIPPTGIIVNNLPFVLVVLLAVSGIAVYFVINRRREQED